MVDNSGLTGTQSRTPLPLDFALAQNFPNPFNQSTVIRYQLMEPMKLTLGIYDITGKEVAVLTDGYQSSGNYQVQWDGLDASGYSVSTGIYFCRLEAGATMRGIKMLSIK